MRIEELSAFHHAKAFDAVYGFSLYELYTFIGFFVEMIDY